MTRKTCRKCGKKLNAVSPSAGFCSNKCRQSAYRARKAEQSKFPLAEWAEQQPGLFAHNDSPPMLPHLRMTGVPETVSMSPEKGLSS